MPNETKGRTWIIDTANEVISVGAVRIKWIKFIPAANGDTYALQNNPERATKETIISGTIRDIDVEGVDHKETIEQWVDGLYIAALTNGAVLQIRID